jgi:hypothetical protein
MMEPNSFVPKRNPGILLHSVLVVALIAGCGVCIWLAFQQTGGGALILYLVGALILLALIPLVGYRGYALTRAVYTIERDGLRIRWGLRSEDIPLNEVEWVRPADDLETPLRLPFFSMPGAILGESVHPDLGSIEFMASDSKSLVIVATMNKVVVVSPENMEDFLNRFQRTIEMGSLTPIQPHTSIPVVFIRQILADRLGRSLIIGGFALTIILLVIVSLSIPGKALLSMGYSPNGGLLEAVSSTRLLLLPILSALFYLISLVAGVYSYRKESTRPVATLLWIGGITTPILLLIAAIIFLLQG